MVQQLKIRGERENVAKCLLLGDCCMTLATFQRILQLSDLKEGEERKSHRYLHLMVKSDWQ